MTGQCKHCSHFCTGRIGSVVSLEWSLKLQGCYLGVCWWTHIGIYPWPHPATTGIVSSWTPKGHKNLSSMQLLQFSDVWPGLDVLFCHPCPLQQHGGCSVLPSQVLPETMPNKRRPVRGFSGPGKHAWHWHWLFHFGFGVSEEDHIFWHYPSYIWVKKRGPHPTIQMAHFGWIAHALLLMYRCCIVFHLSF